MDKHPRIEFVAGKRSGKPCVKGTRITVVDVLGWLSNGMSESDIIDDFPTLNTDDIRACLSFSADVLTMLQRNMPKKRKFGRYAEMPHYMSEDFDDSLEDLFLPTKDDPLSDEDK